MMADQRESPKLAEVLATRRQQIAYTLFGVCGALALVGIFLLLSSRFREYLGITNIRDVRAVLLVFLITLTLAGGLVAQLLRGAGELSEGETLRVVLLALGGLAGTLTTVAGFYLVWNVYSAHYRGLEELRKAPEAVAWPGALIFGGLTLLFLSLQLARGTERTSGLLRRLLYGYNAVLGCLFLFAILLLVNLLSYLPVGPFKVFARSYDWTASGMHTLHPTLRNFVASLDQPVKIILISESSTHPVTEQTRLMLDQVRATNRLVEVEYLSPYREPDKFRLLRKEYDFIETFGLLILYGPEDKPEHRFVKFDDLFDVPTPSRTEGSSRESEHYEFKGQNELYGALVALAEGKKVVVYFTQGHGEPELSQGFSALRRRLEGSNYEVRPLRLEAKAKDKPDELRVPEDADVVVVARPTVNLNELDPKLLPALRDYVRGTGGKKGKLVVLSDVTTEPGRGLIRTGVEDFIAEFNVRIDNDRVLSIRNTSLLTIPGTTNRALAHPREFGQMTSPNPVALAFYPNAGGSGATRFYFHDVRTVEPAGRPGSSVAQVLVITDPRGKGRVEGSSDLFYPYWKEEDLSKNPLAVLKELADDPKRLPKTLTKEPLPLAVAVSEPSSELAPIRGHGGVAGTPQMVVFGDTSWLEDEWLRGGAGDNHFDLFTSCLSWLRESKAIGKTIPVTTRGRYDPGLPEASYSRVYYLPAVLMMLGVTVLGFGVWIVRRR
jgi:hypothetical protein